MSQFLTVVTPFACTMAVFTAARLILRRRRARGFSRFDDGEETATQTRRGRGRAAEATELPQMPAEDAFASAGGEI